MKKSRGVLILVLTVIVTALLIFTSAVGWGPTGTGAAKNINTGLDLAGGVSMTLIPSWKNWEGRDPCILSLRQTLTAMRIIH